MKRTEKAKRRTKERNRKKRKWIDGGKRRNGNNVIKMKEVSCLIQSAKLTHISCWNRCHLRLAAEQKKRPRREFSYIDIILALQRCEYQSSGASLIVLLNKEEGFQSFRILTMAIFEYLLQYVDWSELYENLDAVRGEYDEFFWYFRMLSNHHRRRFLMRSAIKLGIVPNLTESVFY